MIDEIDKSQIIYKMSTDIEKLAYNISHMQDEMAKLSAEVEELRGEKDDKFRRLVS